MVSRGAFHERLVRNSVVQVPRGWTPGRKDCYGSPGFNPDVRWALGKVPRLPCGRERGYQEVGGSVPVGEGESGRPSVYV